MEQFSERIDINSVTIDTLLNHVRSAYAELERRKSNLTELDLEEEEIKVINGIILKSVHRLRNAVNELAKKLENMKITVTGERLPFRLDEIDK